MDNLEKLESLHAKAIPGTWKPVVVLGQAKVITEQQDGTKTITRCPAIGLPQEVELIAHTHNMTPLLVTAAKKLEQLVTAYDAESSLEDMHEFMREGRNAIFHLREDDVLQEVAHIPLQEPVDELALVKEVLIARIQRLAAESPTGMVEMSRCEADADVAWLARADGMALAVGEYNSLPNPEKWIGVDGLVDGMNYSAAHLEDLSLGDLALLAESQAPDPQWSQAERDPGIPEWAAAGRPKSSPKPK